MSRTHRAGMLETQSGKFKRARFVPLGIHFINDKNERSCRAAHHRGHFGIQRRNTINGVRNEKNNVGGLHRNESPFSCALCKIRVGLGSNAARIDDLKRRGAEFADRGDTVACDAGLVMHDRDHATS